MQAAVFTGKEVEVWDELKIDELKAGEVLIKVISSGICHTDVNVIKGRVFVPTPVILGHEVYGVVENIGEGVTRVKPGDYVVAAFIYPCGKCKQCLSGFENLCENSIKARAKGVMLDGTTRIKKNNKEIYVRNGGWAQYMVAPTENCVVPLPPELRIYEIPILGCAFFTSYGAIFNTAKVTAMDRVAIFGVGGVGLPTIKFASIANAAEIIAIDIVEQKLQKAKTMGATLTINSKEEDPIKVIKEVTNGEGVDIAIEAVGNKATIRQAIDSVRVGGKVVLVGMGAIAEFEVNNVVIRGVKVLGHYGARPRIDIPNIIRLIRKKLIDPKEFVTHKFKLNEVKQAIHVLETGEALRSVLIF
ncbi:MAG: zinc-binding dehydrogenase [Candidatus Bathyarchaeia archaeon]